MKQELKSTLNPVVLYELCSANIKYYQAYTFPTLQTRVHTCTLQTKLFVPTREFETYLFEHANIKARGLKQIL